MVAVAVEVLAVAVAVEVDALLATVENLETEVEGVRSGSSSSGKLDIKKGSSGV